MDHAYEFDLVCIGAGPAGRSAAVAAAKLGKRVALVEKRRALAAIGLQGGTFPSKTMREAVRAFKLRMRAATIAQSSETPRFHLDRVKERIQEVCEQEAITLTDQLARNGVEFLNGKARFVDRNTLAIESLYGVREITARFVLIATGTRALEADGAPFDGETFLDEELLFELSELPRSILVLGSNILGLELGSMLGALGVDVTLIDRSTTPLAFLDADVRSELVRQITGRCVRCEFGVPVRRAQMEMTEHGPSAAVELEDGRRLHAESALVAIGRMGVTESLGFEAIGLATTPRGMIEVDARLRTSIENVFAAGDVIGREWQSSSATEQGRLAAYAMFDVVSEQSGSPHVVGLYSVPEVSYVGRTEDELRQAGVAYASGIASYREIARGAMVGDDQGFFKMLFDSTTRKLLGAHCVGINATDLIHVAQAVMALDGTLDYFLDNVFNYPTFAECYKVAAHDAAAKLVETSAPI